MIIVIVVIIICPGAWVLQQELGSDCLLSLGISSTKTPKMATRDQITLATTRDQVTLATKKQMYRTANLL